MSSGNYDFGLPVPCFIIAEAGVNHNGRLDLALRLVDVAVEAGADAVKFQTFIAEQVMSSGAPKAAYQQQTTGADESQLDMVKRLQLDFDSFRQIKDYCDRRGILFLSTPFDWTSADFLDDLGVPLFKVPSGEVVNHPFLEYLARKGKPIIMSTGMCYLSEVDEALRVIRRYNNQPLALLHCTSNYPAAVADVNLLAMQTMSAAFQLPVGYSDHTQGIEIALAAVALGARVIEKHFTLDKTLFGPDHLSSLEPQELQAMVHGIRKVEGSLGHGRKEPAPSEADVAAVARRSLVAACDLPAGTVLTEAHIAILRPGTGIPPMLRTYLLGRTVRTAISVGSLLEWRQLI